MLAAAEAEARARGCRRVYLDTGASPAAGIFLARGYRACGELADYRDGRTRYWLQKVLEAHERAKQTLHLKAPANKLFVTCSSPRRRGR